MTARARDRSQTAYVQNWNTRRLS